MVEEPHGRHEIRKSLMLLDSLLEKDDAQLRFDLLSLQKHNIHVENMSLDKGSAQNPRFFAPYSHVPPVTDEIVEEAKADPPVWDLDSTSTPGNYASNFHFDLRQYASEGIICEKDSRLMKKDWPWVQAPYVHFFSPPLQRLLLGLAANWVRFSDHRGRLWTRLDCQGVPRSPDRVEASNSLEVLRAANPQLPHVQAAIAVNGEVKDGEFLRVEIRDALRLMIHQMRQPRLIPHMKIPVQLLHLPSVVTIH